MDKLRQELENEAQPNILKSAKQDKLFVGNAFYLDYNKANILTCDEWKNNVGGIPQGCLMLAFYKNPFDTVKSEEAILLRAIKPCSIPSDSDLTISRIEFYKEDIDITEMKSKGKNLDDFTRFEFSFSGIECSVLGTFYKAEKEDEKGNKKEVVEFGADVENYFSAHYYKVYKLTGENLGYVVNRPDNDTPIKPDANFKIGKVRYSSSRSTTDATNEKEAVFIHTEDLLGKRTALFGMTRTGKSNTVKKLIEATENLSLKAPLNLNDNKESFEESTKPFTEKELPKYPVGQIIFDINGEYANKNLQDGTAIFEKYEKKVIRYSVVDKTDQGFKVLKTNFYEDIKGGFDLIKSKLSNENIDYIKSLLAIDISLPENYHLRIAEKTSDERNAAIEYDRKKAAYICCLHAARFPLPKELKKIKFYGDADTINLLYPEIIPHDWITIDEAITWFTTIFDSSGSSDEIDYKGVKRKKLELFEEYKKNKKKDFLDEDLKALLVFLTRKPKPLATASYSGYRKLRDLISLHTDSSDTYFEIKITNQLREGNIVIVDLSQGDPKTQALFSEKICKAIFDNSMDNFIKPKPNNFIQFYFEEAHNLFPQKEDKDLSQIYNRLAKEGAKLNLGLIYATQEVSSISSNILKNTQNWFIAHLNNEDEIKELRKFYDFSDFASSLIRFSAKNDKGFVRMKTYSNPFVVPVQIDKFE